MPISPVIVSAASGVANFLGNALQHKLSDNIKYSDYIGALRSVGATPTSITQGLSGSAGGSTPGFSNSMPDLGATMNNALSADAAQKNAAAAAEEASAATTRAETERQLGLMHLRLDPMKYFADIRKSLSEAFKNTNEAFLHGSMKQYYDELTTDIQKVRPWKLAGLQQGLLNDMATYNKIVQETRTSKAQEGYFNSAAYQARTQGDLNLAQKDFVYSESLNESLRGFRLQWENTLLSYGIDPNKPFFENTARLMSTNPELFSKRMDVLISSLNFLDDKLQDNLGEHYKRNIGVGLGLHYLNKVHQKNANDRAYRFGEYLRGVSSLIPFAGGMSSSAPIGYRR